MKKLLFLLVAIAVLSAVGCGANEDMGDEGVSTTAPPIIDTPTPDPSKPSYPDVRGNYACTVVETVNTCRCSGARGQLEEIVLFLVEQNVNEATGPEDWAYLSAPAGIYWTENEDANQWGFQTGASLSTAGVFTREAPITGGTIHYSSVFGIEDGAVNHLTTTTPHFLTLNLDGGGNPEIVCCNTEDGQAILTLDCPKM